MPTDNATRIRRRLETVRVTPPDDDVIDEILRWAIKDGIVEEPTGERDRQKAYDEGWDDGLEHATDHDAFDRGYALGKSARSNQQQTQGT